VIEEFGKGPSSSITFLDWVSGNDISSRILCSGLSYCQHFTWSLTTLIMFQRFTGGNVLLEQMKNISLSKILRISWNLEINVKSPYTIPLGLAAFINVDINEERFCE
jgi:hypothetical protein